MTEGNAEPTPGLQGPAPAHEQLVGVVLGKIY
jgi:hypothetical protein